MEKENIFLAEEKKIGEGKGGKFLEKENLDKIQKNSSFFSGTLPLPMDHGRLR